MVIIRALVNFVLLSADSPRQGTLYTYQGASSVQIVQKPDFKESFTNTPHFVTECATVPNASLKTVIIPTLIKQNLKWTVNKMRLQRKTYALRRYGRVLSEFVL